MAETIRAIVTPLSAGYPPHPGAVQDGRALRPRCVDTHHRDGLTFGAGKRRRGDLRRCHSYLSQRYRLPIPCALSRALRRMRAQPAAVDRAWSIFVTLSVKERPAVRRPSLRSMTRARTSPVSESYSSASKVISPAEIVYCREMPAVPVSGAFT